MTRTSAHFVAATVVLTALPLQSKAQPFASGLLVGNQSGCTQLGNTASVLDDDQWDNFVSPFATSLQSLEQMVIDNIVGGARLDLSRQTAPSFTTELVLGDFTQDVQPPCTPQQFSVDEAWVRDLDVEQGSFQIDLRGKQLHTIVPEFSSTTGRIEDELVVTGGGVWTDYNGISVRASFDGTTGPGLLRLSGISFVSRWNEYLAVGDQDSPEGIRLSDGGRVEFVEGTAAQVNFLFVGGFEDESESSVLIDASSVGPAFYDGDNPADADIKGTFYSTLSFGGFGPADVTVRNGGSLSATEADVGSEARVEIIGPTSSWSLTEDLTVGGEAAAIELVDGSSLSVGGAITMSAGASLLLDGATVDATSINVSAGAAISGVGQITAAVRNDGWLRPGSSPGIISIDGDYDQGPTGALEIEIGGLIPGAEHDQLQVTGAATLGGRIDLPLISPTEGGAVFVPTVGEEIVAITAASVAGEFDLITSANLGTVAPGVAIEIVENATDVRVRFVAPSTAIDFVRTTAGTTNWADPLNWTSGQTPDSTNIISLENLAASNVQRLVVTPTALPDSDNAFAHEVTVRGTATDAITLEVESNLSATVGLAVSQNGIVEIDGGTVATAVLTVNEGGSVIGRGSIIGDLTVAAPTGEAVVSPGTLAAPLGDLAVDGDYAQSSGGMLEVEVMADETSDTLAVSGEADLGGSLMIDATDLTAADAGETIEFLTAGGGVMPGTVFDEVMTENSTEVYLSPIYREASVALQVNLVGDMNGDGTINTEDIGAFALGLSNPLEFFRRYFVSPDAAGGNLDDNNRLDFDDIDEFAELVDGVSSTYVAQAVAAALRAPVVPEPSASWIALIASTAIGVCRPSPSR